MKTLLTLFVLLFSSSVFAEDISDFQIEGMGVGDSLLDYFSEEEIKNNTMNYYKNSDGKFIAVEFWKHTSFKIYEGLQVTIKKNDNNFLIYGINGAIYFKDINLCKEKQKKVEKDMSNVFLNATKSIENYPYSFDLSGKSFIYGIYFDYPSGDYAQVSCYDFSNEYGGDDHLRIGLISNEFYIWLQSF